MLNGYPFTLFMESQPNGCNFYRIRQPYLKLSSLGNFPCASNKDLTADELDDWVDKAEVVVTQAATSDKFLEYMKSRRDKKFVIDLDDNLFSVSPFNPSYRVHGTREVDLQTSGASIKIRDGQNGFDLKANQHRISTAIECLETCDLITTPSSLLAEVLTNFNKKVQVIRNLLDFDVWTPVNIQKDEFIRIGWQGGWSHYEDFCSILPALKAVMHKHKNVKLVIMGTHFEGVTKDLPQDRIEVHSWTSVEVYPWKFKTLNIDIGIAPICMNEFNMCKSEIKWEEYSALGIPTIASAIPPYSVAIDDEKTGLLAEGKDEWIECLEKLIVSKDLRDKIQSAAKAKVLAHYDLNKKVEEYMKVYKSVCGVQLVAA